MMEERLEYLIQHYEITASKLADLLDVQRSGISHILAGRNKPSYDFLIRLLDHFPEIDANWLLTGAGSMYKNPVNDAENVNSSRSPQTQTSHWPQPLLQNPELQKTP